MLLVWAVFVAVQVAALVLGLWLGRGVRPAAARRRCDTSRLALVGSTALFAVLSLVLWSVVSYVAGRALKDLLYQPVVFGRGYRSADIFLDDRVQTSAGSSRRWCLHSRLLASAALLVLLPSLLEEISPTTNVDADGRRPEAAVWSERLGGWLGGGSRWLGRAFTIAWCRSARSSAACCYLAFVFRQFAFAAAWRRAGRDGLPAGWTIFEGETLVAAGKWLAGGALTIAALGSRFTQTFGRLRVAIDAVLDIDNYFGDPPNRQPPRARIYSRYASLLAYLRDARLCAHRHRLAQPGHRDQRRSAALPARAGAIARASSARSDRARHRGLAAARPVRGALPAPVSMDGLERGRLRRPRSRARRTSARSNGSTPSARETMSAVSSGRRPGRGAFRHRRGRAGWQGGGRRAGDRTEFCLGAGAHTHYFSNDAVALAVEIDRLIEG